MQFLSSTELRHKDFKIVNPSRKHLSKCNLKILVYSNNSLPENMIYPVCSGITKVNYKLFAYSH